MSGKDDRNNDSLEVTGSGAAASHGSVAAGEGGIAVGGDVNGSVVVAHEGAQVTITYHGTNVAIPSPEAVQRHRVALREQLQADAQRRWGGMSVYIQEEGATLPIQASPYQAGQLGPRQNLLQLLHAADRLLVLGEPGTGKTVAMERLAWELCDGAEPSVPVLIRLFQYTVEVGAWDARQEAMRQVLKERFGEQVSDEEQRHQPLSYLSLGILRWPKRVRRSNSISICQM